MAHQFRCELQYRDVGDKLVRFGGWQFKCEISLPAKDRAEFMKQGNKREDWKAKDEWCDENGEIKQEYKCSGDAIIDFWDWKGIFWGSDDTTEIVRCLRRRAPRLLYGQIITLQLVEQYLTRTADGSDFRLQRGDRIIKYKFAEVGCTATKLYLQGLNKIVQVANSFYNIDSPSAICNENVSSRASKNYTDEELQRFILVKTERYFNTSKIRLKLQNKKPANMTIGKKIVQIVELLRDLGILTLQQVKNKGSKAKSGNSSSNSNSNDKSEKKRSESGRGHTVYECEKLTSSEWSGAANDAILEKLGELGILKSSYDLVNMKIKVEQELKGSDDDVEH